MNLGEKALIVANAVSKNLSVQSFAMHDNNLGTDNLTDLFSIMKINKDIKILHNEKRLKLRANAPIL